MYRLVPLLAAAILVSGCATMMNGPTQAVRVKSQPAGARVVVDGCETGVTPLTVRLSRMGSHRVRVELDGYEPYEVPLVKRASRNIEGNILVGFAPVVVDVLTGAVFELDVPREEREKMPVLPHEVGDPPRESVIFTPTLVITTTLMPIHGSRRVGQMKKS